VWSWRSDTGAWWTPDPRQKSNRVTTPCNDMISLRFPVESGSKSMHTIITKSYCFDFSCGFTDGWPNEQNLTFSSKQKTWTNIPVVQSVIADGSFRLTMVSKCKQMTLDLQAPQAKSLPVKAIFSGNQSLSWISCTWKGEARYAAISGCMILFTMLTEWPKKMSQLDT
jgi:hypothetical protein